MIRCCFFWILWCVVSTTARNVGTFWHFTDFHVNMSDSFRNSSGKWGDYEHDASTIVAFTGIETGGDYGFAENQPDFVIWGGDAAPHWTTSKEILRRSLKFLTHHMKNAFPTHKVPLIPVVGNHDVAPPNQMSPAADDKERIAWCTELASSLFWKPWVDSDSFRNGCYIASVINLENPIMIVGLNSLVWYTDNRLVNGSIKDPLGQFDWLLTRLEAAKSQGFRVILTMHVPFGTHETRPNGYTHLLKNYNDRLVEIIRNYSSIIMTTIASHEHLDAFRVILDDKYRPISTMFLGPAISPIHLDGVGSNNPRLRQFYYDRDVGTILDYKQFYLNLEKDGPSWEVEYNAAAEYNLQNLTATELAKMLDEFTVEDDKGRWSSYWKHQLGGRPHDKPPKRQDGQCPSARSVCRCEQICSIRHLDWKSLESCLKVCKSSDTPQLDTIEELMHGKGKVSNAGTIVGIVIGVLLLTGLLIGIGFVIYRRWRDY